MDNEESVETMPRTLLTVSAVIIILIIILGVLGNLLTILVYSLTPKIRNATAAFIVSLSFADLFFCIFVLPFSASRFIHGKWKYGDFVCKLYSFVEFGNVGVSLLFIMMISINRYVKIVHCQMYERIYTPLRTAAMIVFCWLVSFLMQLPTLLGVWGTYGYDEKLFKCDIVEDDNGRSSKSALFIIAFTLTFSTIIYCYSRIFVVYFRSKSRIRQNSTFQQSDRNKNADNQRDLRFTLIMFTIFISFIACYVPQTIITLVDEKKEKPALYVVGYDILSLSACVNPIIYALMNKQFRDGIIQLLPVKNTFNPDYQTNQTVSASLK
ncbi:G-protein coupled receptor moody-like [Neocloeon triangulifer]|uniref:G-protein coupled receptor moody-like n=1 Tax=Neocloeon triangulifer TaxID=2078957 RepID=UPI00286F5B32|nr:G-protein coupled receptor moody-like [Neocloeon triangulifer]XP_059482549.1 G-protein coupled receptor moody-like [Neocloeon triangulifer]